MWLALLLGAESGDKLGYPRSLRDSRGGSQTLMGKIIGQWPVCARENGATADKSQFLDQPIVPILMVSSAASSCHQQKRS